MKQIPLHLNRVICRNNTTIKASTRHPVLKPATDFLLSGGYFFRYILTLLVVFVFGAFSSLKAFEKSKVAVKAKSVTSGQRQRVVVSTDIGGTDPDDFQSMVHLLLYSDTLDIEGLISSPYGPGRKEHILKVIDCYEKDYPNIKTYSDKYPTPDQLRAITKEGSLETPGPIGVSEPTEGSEWIISCARRNDPRPLNILVWGGIEDLAQALHDAPDILPKLRVYFIGGPNKKWSVDAYNYVANNYKNLWIIESNDTYRGWFTGGNQTGEWGNKEFVARNIAGNGALGDFFNNQLGGTIKMGDTPSVGWLLRGTPEDPSKPGWGGSYVRAWERPHKVFNRLTNVGDSIEQFGVLELELPVGSWISEKTSAALKVENQLLIGLVKSNGNIEFLFSPKEAKTYSYTIQSNLPELNGKTGSITSYLPPKENKLHPALDLPNWWTDDPSPEVAEGVIVGSKTVSQWREEFLKDFAKRFLRCKTPAIKKTAHSNLGASEKKRVIVLTDIENEPDDAMSMVRFLTYSNQWDVEGLVATTSVHQKSKTAAWRIREIVDAYGKVRDNLEKHETGFPTADYLLSKIRDGRTDYGMNAVGEGMDSPGSEIIVQAADREDKRPAWVVVWGGPNCLAQALWKVKKTRSPEEVDRFVSKLRIYTVSDQDDSGPWMRKTFPNLFYIASPGFHAWGGYHYATWSGISGDKFHGRFVGADFSIVDNPWLDKNIRCKGPLGEQYPQFKFLMEGDTPTFLYLINNGLGDPEHPDWGSWGGRYEFYTPRLQKWFIEPETRPFWSNAEDEVFGVDSCWHTSSKATIWRWRSAYQNDFAARMDWTIKPYAEANHPPVPKINHPDQLTVKIGERVNLSAEGSTDPDGNALSYKWFYYGEPGTLAISTSRTGAPLKIEDADKVNAWFTVTKATKLGTMHVILAVTDQGTPALTRYQRVIITIIQ